MASQYAIDDSEWDEVVVINGYAVFMGYLLMGVRGLGVLILTWAAVVRLGGSASDLGKKDFWCLAAITLIQTAGVFEFLLKEKISDMVQSWWGLLAAIIAVVSGNRRDFGRKREVITYILLAIQVPVIAIILCLFGVMYMLGLYISAGVSSWRLIEHDFGNEEAPNMKPALQVLYSLAVAQGVLLGYKDILACGATKRLAKLMVRDHLVDEEELVAKYIEETVAGCQKDPSFATGRNFVTYGMDMIMEAKSNKGFIVGIKILGGALKDRSESGRKVLAKHLLTRLDSSMHVIERLLETVGPRSPYSREVREHAARIVAVVARRIRLEQFPGVIECISSVLDPSSAAAEEYKQKRDYQFIKLYEEYVEIKNICTVKPHELRDYEGVEVLDTYELDYLVKEIKSPEAGSMQQLVQFLVGLMKRLVQFLVGCTKRLVQFLVGCIMWLVQFLVGCTKQLFQFLVGKRRRLERQIEMPVSPPTHRKDQQSGLDGLLREAANIIGQLAVDGDNRRIMSNTVIDMFAMAPRRLHRDNSHDPILGKYWVQWLVAALKWTNSQRTLEEGQPAAAASSGGGERRSGKEVVVEEGSSSNVGSARGVAIDNIKHTIISIFDCLECGATQKKQAIQILLYLSSDMSFIMDTESRKRRLHWILALIYYSPLFDMKSRWIIGFTHPPDGSTTFFRILAHKKLSGWQGAGETATRLALEDLADALSNSTEDISIRTHATIILQDLCSGWYPDMKPHGEELKGILLRLLPKVVEEILICSDMENDVVSEGHVLASRMSRVIYTDNERLLKALTSGFQDGSKRFPLMYDADFKELISKTCQEKGKSFEHFESLLTPPKQGEEDSHSGTS